MYIPKFEMYIPKSATYIPKFAIKNTSGLENIFYC